MMPVYNSKDIYRYYKKQGGTLAYNVYKEIIAENNRRISNIIINLGYEYMIPHLRGILKIVKNKRKITITEDNGTVRGAVNWGETKKLKARLIEEGKILYECKKDETGKIVWDNEGEKYLVYHTDDYYYTWAYLAYGLMQNSSNYDFSPTWTNSRNLVASITEDSDLLYIVKTHGRTSKNNFIQTIAAKNRQDVQLEQQ